MFGLSGKELIIILAVCSGLLMLVYFFTVMIHKILEVTDVKIWRD